MLLVSTKNYWKRWETSKQHSMKRCELPWTGSKKIVKRTRKSDASKKRGTLKNRRKPRSVIMSSSNTRRTKQIMRERQPKRGMTKNEKSFRSVMIRKGKMLVSAMKRRWKLLRIGSKERTWKPRRGIKVTLIVLTTSWKTCKSRRTKKLSAWILNCKKKRSNMLKSSRTYKINIRKRWIN